MSAYYIERNNMSGNGGMDQPQNGGAPGQQRNPGMPNGGMQPGGLQPGGQGNGGSQMGSQGSQMGSQGAANGSAPGSTPGANGGASTGRDYRDDLRELLDRAHSERGLTRYRLCKQMGIDSGTLSNVLAKRRHFSLEKLEQILGLLGYRLSFTQGEAPGASGTGAANGASNGSQGGSTMGGSMGSGSMGNNSMGSMGGMTGGRGM